MSTYIYLSMKFISFSHMAEESYGQKLEIQKTQWYDLD